ncbi:hypothetical protein SAY86_001164 [Trapa natans]|uniref:Kinetochore protein Nuf2 N-terminal domain-containing protein n=1 Tax=Trapa natans TaxID=22666 RepID=A0AAN7MG40_TRANT|nr:hypothetical protein SAY86_001164 [Trapa natans]
MSRFEYPRLTRSEIVEFLKEYQIIPNITEYHLAELNPDFISDLYTQLLIYLDLFQEEDGQMEFAALERLENPDFHVDSLRRINLCSKIKELVTSLECPKKFTLKDLTKPDADRTELFVSAILNFCFHKDNKMNLIRPIVDELNDLDAQQKQCEDKISQLNAEIEEHNEARKEDIPLIEKAREELEKFRMEISELNKKQMSLRTDCRNLREKVEDMDKQMSSAEYMLVQSVQENAKIRSEIVQSPDKLQRALEEKKLVRREVNDAAKSAKQSFEDKNGILEVYSKTHKKMSKHLTQMQKILEQVNSAKTIEKDVKALKAKLSDEVIQDKQLDAELVKLQGREEHLDELRRSLEKEKDVRCQEADRELNNVKLETESKRHELELRQKKVEAVLEEADAITLRTKSVNESSEAKQQELLHKSEDIMKEFRQYLCSIEALLPTVKT